jgi:hypothetical protein
MSLRIRAGLALLATTCVVELRAQDYGHYPTPAACVAAVQRVEAAATWDRELADSLPYDAKKGLSAEAIETARACAGRFFSGEGRAKLKDTDGLFLVALAAREDSTARAALDEVVRRQRSRKDSIDVLAYASFALSGTKPGRLAEARETGARLDSLGYLGDDLKTSGWSTPRQSALHLATAGMDSAAMVGEAEALLATIGRLPKEELATAAVQYAVQTALSADLPWAVRAHGVDSAVARLLARAKGVLGPQGFADSSLGRALTILGKPVPMPQPDFWFNRTEADSVLPSKGRVTLFAGVSPGCTWCNTAALRRIRARFGDSLDVILLANTGGRIGELFFPDPRKEAEEFRRILSARDKLDAKLAIWVTKYDRLPDPDRRLVGQPLPAMMQYYYAGGTLLVDQRGIAVAPVSPTYAGTEAYVVRMVEALLKR